MLHVRCLRETSLYVTLQTRHKLVGQESHPSSTQMQKKKKKKIFLSRVKTTKDLHQQIRTKKMQVAPD